MPHESDISAQKFIDNLETLKSRRSNYDKVNQDITDYVLPNRGNFTTQRAPGEELDRIIFDSTAITANQNLASVLAQGLTDPNTMWARFRPKDPKLLEIEEVKRWLEKLEQKVFNVFTSSELGFAQQNHELLLDLCGYGTAIMFVGEQENGDILFQTRHLSEIWIEENSSGFVDTVYRQFELTARQAEQKWGEENLGPKILEMLKTKPHEKFEFINVVLPKKDYERSISKIESSLENFEFISLNISKDDKKVISSKGFHEMPYIVVRWLKRIGEVYGISPSWNALSDIFMINGFAEVGLKSVQKQVDPPLLMSDDGVIMPLQTFPGGVNIGGLNDDGKENIKPLITGQNNAVLVEVLSRLELKIEKAYFVDQFQQREGVQPLTATESIHREQSKLRLIGPQVRRVEDEYLNLALIRVISMLQRKGELEEPPEALLVNIGGKQVVDFSIEYIGPLAFTQQTNQLLSYNRFFANVGTFVEIKRDVMDNFDIDAIVRDGAEKSGIPLKQIKKIDEVRAFRKAKAEAQAAENLKADIETGANTAATLQKAGIPVIPTE